MTYVLTLVSASEGGVDPELTALILQALNATGSNWLKPGQALDIFHNQLFSPARLNDLIGDAPIDAILQVAAGRRKKLLVADMESTMIAEEMLDELADLKNIRHHISSITARAMNGELEFRQALAERVQLLAGLPITALAKCWEAVTINPGAATLVATMKAHGARAVLVSGGFTFFTERLRKRLGFDADFGNQLGFDNGHLSGGLIEPIRDKDDKLAVLRAEAAALSISVAECVAIGDGANDLPMLQAAGLGIAYYAKPTVRDACRAQINHTDLTTLLYAQGYKSQEFALRP